MSDTPNLDKIAARLTVYVPGRGLVDVPDTPASAYVPDAVALPAPVPDWVAAVDGVVHVSSVTRYWHNQLGGPLVTVQTPMGPLTTDPRYITLDLAGGDQ